MKMQTAESNVVAMMRDGLRRLAKAVVVITTAQGGQRHAMAATAVSELSMNPPSLLICVNRSASLHPVLAGGAPFCVNILHAAQGNISRACSGTMKGEARFTLGDWDQTVLDIPRLAEAQASFVCTNDQCTDYGTHSIFIGRVAEMFVNGAVDPLVYVDGRYTSIGSDIDC